MIEKITIKRNNNVVPVAKQNIIALFKIELFCDSSDKINFLYSRIISVIPPEQANVSMSNKNFNIKIMIVLL